MVILAIAAVLLVVRRVHASGSGLRAELIYGDNNTTMNPVSYTHLDVYKRQQLALLDGLTRVHRQRQTVRIQMCIRDRLCSRRWPRV